MDNIGDRTPVRKAITDSRSSWGLAPGFLAFGRVEADFRPEATPPGGPREPQGALRRLVSWLRHEIRQITDIAAYFSVVFLLLQLTRLAILGKFALREMDPLRAVVESLLVAKAIVIADAFRWVARYDHRPVARSALWKTWIYFLLCMTFEYVDSLVEFRRAGFPGATRMFAGRLSTSTFWMIQAWLLILLFAFAAARDLVRRMGNDRFRELFFGVGPARLPGK